MERTKICFVAPYTYSLFNPAKRYVFGGSEIRAWLFGKGLSQYPENDVSFIVLDHKQPKVEHYGLVEVYSHSFYKTYLSPTERLLQDLRVGVYRLQKFPFIQLKVKQYSLIWKLPLVVLLLIALKSKSSIKRLFRPSLYIDGYEIVPRKFSIYRKVNADIYCAFGVGDFTAELASYCKHAKKKLVLFAGSDSDFLEQYYSGSQEKNVYGSNDNLCYYAIMQADLIVTQTNDQARLLQERFGRNSTTILSPVDLSQALNVKEELPVGKKIALWVGKSDKVKRPEILIQLATELKEIDFVMILNRSDSGLFEEIIHAKLSNVRIFESVDFREMEKLFAQAFVLINTSIFEGFPNTFLQAGKYGVPILSLQVDPDGFIEKRTCGIVAKGDIGKFAEGLRRLALETSLRETCSKNIKRYILSHHELKDKVNQLNQNFKELLVHGV